MNNESPLIPKGSLMEQKNKSRIRFKFAVFAVLGAHAIALVALLMAGCNKDKEATPNPLDTKLPSETLKTDTSLPPANTNVAPAPDTGSLPVVGSENTNLGNVGTPITSGAPPTTGAVPLPGNGGTVPPTGIAPTVPGAMTDYTIVQGDTLGKIAKRSHITLAALQAANPGVDSSKLKLKQVIHIPPPATPAPNPGVTGAPTTGTVAPEIPSDVYVVKSGDSLIKIAKDNGVTVKALRAVNALKTNRIHVGDKLKLPPRTAAAPTAGGTPAPAAGSTVGGVPAPGR